VLALDDGHEVAPLALSSRQPRDKSGASAPENRASARSSQLMFAGLELELTGDAVACARVDRAARAGTPAGGASAPEGTNVLAPKFAGRCRLQMIPPLSGEREPPPSGLAWSWTAQDGELLTRFAGARVWAVPSGFEGKAWLEGDARAAHHLLGGLAVMLTHRLGGGVFHAASVELDDAVVAFVGPSGAGKTTACHHVEGAPLVSVDRLAVVPIGPRLPQGSRWFSHPLPGGTRPLPDLPSAPSRWRPLAAVLRVQPSAARTAIVTPAPALAVTLLRESTFQTGLERSAELELLGALDDLVQHVPVGRLELQLGASLKPLLRRWLKSQAEELR
jgi:hypothetical protein